MPQLAPDRPHRSEAAVAPGLPVIDVVEDDNGFSALRAEWNRLADQLDPPSPFMSWEWADAWWKHLRPGGRSGAGCRLQIVTMHEGGRLIGLAPLYRRTLSPRWAGVSFLLPIGWEAGRGWAVTEQLELVFPECDRERLLRALCAWLQPCRWSVAVIPGLHESDALPAWLVEHSVARGHATPFLYRRLPSSWDEFVGGLNKSLRGNVRYYPRLLERHGHQTAFTVASTPADVATALPTLFALHRARALAPMSVEHHDYFYSPERRSFFRTVAPALAASGRLKIGVLWLGGTPIAAQMWLENDGVMFLYYSGYDPAWSRYSVALVATLGALRNAIERGLRQVEFLAGRGHFRERWEPSGRSRFNLTLAAHPALLRALFAAGSARRFIRRLS